MENILAHPRRLLYATPETKGMIVYQLTRHSVIDHARPDNWDSWEPLSKRKRAVMAVFQYTHTRRDYWNILQHMSRNGTKVDQYDAEKNVMEFLEIGSNNSVFDDQLRQQFQGMKLSLKENPTRGYAVAPNTSDAYQTQMATLRDHPKFGIALA